MTQPSKFSTDAHSSSEPAAAASVRSGARPRTLPPPPPPAAYSRSRSDRPAPIASWIAPRLETELAPELSAYSLFASPLAAPAPGPAPAPAPRASWLKPAAAAASASALVLLVAGGSYLLAERWFDSPSPTLTSTAQPTAAKAKVPAPARAASAPAQLARAPQPSAARSAPASAAPATDDTSSQAHVWSHPAHSAHLTVPSASDLPAPQLTAADHAEPQPQPKAEVASTESAQAEPPAERAVPAESQPAPAAISGENETDDAMQSAPAADLPEALTREQVQTGLEQLRGKLAACAGDAHGTTYANITIAGTGRVSYSTIEGAFAGTPAGSCMARTLRSGSFPKFGGEPLKVRYPFGL
jgi:hypothetical protein